jgi:putative ABC transport system permease protein
MMIVEPMRDALRALRVNVLRSVLTTLGIIIGVAAVIVMVSVGTGAEAKVAELINSLGSNLIYVSPGTTTAGGIRLGTGSLPTTTEDDAEAIQREILEAQIVACTVRGAGQVVFGNLNWSTVIYGVTPDYFEAREWEIENGRGFTPEDNKGSAKVVILGQTVSDNLFPGQDPVGQVIRTTRVPAEVIGVLKAKGQSLGGQDLDDVVFVPLSTARKKILGGRSRSGRLVGAIVIKAQSPELVATVENQTRELLRQRHRLRPGQDDDFSIRNLAQVLETQAESSRAMALLLAAVASVSLMVGGIGIMNIMLVSVTERTREIGLRMAVGARSRDILAQFLTEAVALSMIGGAVGIMLGIAGSVAFTAFGKWPAIVKPGSVLLAFSVSAAVGIFFGFYPARKASRLDPIEALRRE